MSQIRQPTSIQPEMQQHVTNTTYSPVIVPTHSKHRWFPGYLSRSVYQVEYLA